MIVFLLALILRKLGAVSAPLRPRVSVTPLYKDSWKTVQVELMLPEKAFTRKNTAGYEMLVLSGSVIVDGDDFTAFTWFRFPAGKVISFVAGKNGARIWVELGHLTGSVLRSEACLTLNL